MKLSNFRALLVLAALVNAAACEKNAVQVLDDPDAGNGANVKFFNFAVGSPSVNFYVNDQKVSAASATGCFILDDANRTECLSSGRESTAGVAYGSAGHGTNAWYSDVAPGQITITGRISGATDKNLVIANIPATVEAGKFYSYYMSGIYNTTAKTAEAFVVEDVMPPVSFDSVYVRFVNASSTTQPMALHLTNRTTTEQTVVGPPVAYQSATAFVAIAPGSYDLAARTAGSTTNVFTRTQVTFNPGRVYTLAARGNTATASTMFIDNTANR